MLQNVNFEQISSTLIIILPPSKKTLSLTRIISLVNQNSTIDQKIRGRIPNYGEGYERQRFLRKYASKFFVHLLTIIVNVIF